MTSDRLVQPWRLKRLTLHNRIMITAHEPACHVEHARGTCAGGAARNTYAAIHDALRRVKDL